MQIDSCDVVSFSEYLSELGKNLKDIAQKKTAVEEECTDEIYSAEQNLEGFRKKLRQTVRSQRAALKKKYKQREKRVYSRHEKRLSRIDRAYRTSTLRINENEKKARERKEHDLASAKEKITRDLEKKIEKGMEKPTPYTERINNLQERAGVLQEKIESLASACKVELDPLHEPTAVDLLEKIHDLEYAVRDAEEVMDNTERAVRMLRRSYWPVRRAGTVFLFILYIVFYSTGIWYAREYGFLDQSLPWIAISFLAIILLTFAGIRRGRKKIRTVAHWLRVNVANSVEHLSRLEYAERERIAYDATINERMERMLAAEKRVEDDENNAQKVNGKTLKDLEERYKRISGKMPARLEKNLKKLKRDRADEKRASKEKYRKQLDEKAARTAERTKRAEEEQKRKIAELNREWDTLFRTFGRAAYKALEVSRDAFPPWKESVWDRWPPPSEFPPVITVGQSRIGFNELADEFGSAVPFPFPEADSAVLPVSLGFPGTGCVFIRTGPDAQENGLDILKNTVLRILTSFPPSQAKLTIVDPVGLGQAFSAFMRLGDYDESLVTNRIWTEAGHIEQRLTDLTEHMEKVIQKYLRNQYTTIDDYNREAGVLKEAYRFLIITDFPAGFSDIALERLASVISSGARCGVYTMILHDGRQEFPDTIDKAFTRSSGLLLNARADECSVDMQGFRSGTFVQENPPDPERTTAILEQVGEQAEKAERVEVPFEAAAPRDGDMWSRKADEDILVPLGKSGADRIQHIGLGHGTQQHALIGGRTGSGKSTLFHVLITNASLWYSPEEVEFYLIDFKKGVEFKRLANGRLPHARAIGIESDREFGLSVLRRVNDELSRRGELFREAGVQNLAGFRRSGSGINLPRTLLIIDEFQEFFTEDDAIARDAALYLDRFVRQGRAFGIHVILGSQTLSGLYTLAKSTLGQIGVRISLQCNEADSHLILGEDNTAARLLARPGEAIYNDMSGLIEGNQPFQVVWLPEDVQKDFLSRIAEKAEKEKWKPETPTVVFEGNAPAELERNEELFDMLGSGYTDEQSIERVWIGESSSIRGPAQIEFLPNTGSNLLIAGQHREAAYALAACSIISLCARFEPGCLDIAVMMSGERDEFRKRFEYLADTLPHGIDIVMPKQFPELFERAAEHWDQNQEGGSPSDPFFLIAFGIQRMRTLRQDDDLMFSMDRDAGSPPSERFAEILTEGPEANVHSIVWCDGLGSLNRTFSRRTMREFDMKILFQMSASDSSELIDDTAANSLGLYGALLSVESEGVVEKFRPYAVPDKSVLEKIKEAIERKSGT